MSRLITWLSCALITLLIWGCAATNFDASSPYPYTSEQRAAQTSGPRQPQINAASSAEKPQTQATPRNVADQSEPVGTPFRPQIIYTAELGLRVDRVEVTQKKIEDVVASYGGYIGESRTGRLVARIPADSFTPALDELADLGEIINKEVQALDATERIVDLESRLRSAQALRDRLIEMIDKADNMEHALKIGQELGRVNEQIELIQGRLRLAQQQVAYSTINITISPTPEEQRLRSEIPIVWVRELGQVFNDRARIDVTTPRKLHDGVGVELPEGFVRYYQENYVTQAINADGVRVRVRRLKNFEDGQLAFWSQLIERSLRDNAQLEITQRKPVTLYRDRIGQLIRGEKKIAGETVRYLVATSVSNDYVYVFEAWGVAEGFDRTDQKLDQAISSMRCYEGLLQ